MRKKCRPILLAWPVFVWACAPGDVPVQAKARIDAEPGEAVSAPPVEERIAHLEARFGTPATLWGEATYKVKRVNGERLREMEVEVENAEPGSQHILSLDGFELGTMTVGLDGEGEFEVSEEDEQLFPADFPEPQAGSVFRVGELMELQLLELEKLTELAIEFREEALSGKVGFKIERLGDTVIREFKVKLESAPPRKRLAVRLDDVQVGDLKVDSEGKGKLAFSNEKGQPFPEAFPEPRAGSRVRIGDVFQGELLDVGASARNER